jgi:hypothetical protein
VSEPTVGSLWDARRLKLDFLEAIRRAPSCDVLAAQIELRIGQVDATVIRAVRLLELYFASLGQPDNVSYAQQGIASLERGFRLIATLEVARLGPGSRRHLEVQRRRLQRVVSELPLLENPFVPSACGGMCGWSF